jgi:hypothetical protein
MELSLSFLDVFSGELLDKVYDEFEKHINCKEFDESFFTVVSFKLLAGSEWERIKKVMNDFDTIPNLENIADFLVAHCFTVWFAKNHLINRDFTYLEKTALVGWVTFSDSEEEGACPESFITSIRMGSDKSEVIDYFDEVVALYSEDYQNFLNDGGDNVVN